MDVEEELHLEQHALRGMNEGSTPQVADVRAHLAGGMYNSAWERVLEHVAQVFGLGQEGFFEEVLVMQEVEVKAMVHAVQDCARKDFFDFF